MPKWERRVRLGEVKFGRLGPMLLVKDSAMLEKGRSRPRFFRAIAPPRNFSRACNVITS
jgi:hypothetical protein